MHEMKVTMLMCPPIRHLSVRMKLSNRRAKDLTIGALDYNMYDFTVWWREGESADVHWKR